MCCERHNRGYLLTSYDTSFKKQINFHKMTSCWQMSLFQYTSAAISSVLYNIMHNYYNVYTYLVERRESVQRSAVLGK
jgi:hypothetical protein